MPKCALSLSLAAHNIFADINIISCCSHTAPASHSSAISIRPRFVRVPGVGGCPLYIYIHYSPIHIVIVELPQHPLQCSGHQPASSAWSARSVFGHPPSHKHRILSGRLSLVASRLAVVLVVVGIRHYGPFTFCDRVRDNSIRLGMWCDGKFADLRSLSYRNGGKFVKIYPRGNCDWVGSVNFR